MRAIRPLVANGPVPAQAGRAVHLNDPRNYKGGLALPHPKLISSAINQKVIRRRPYSQVSTARLFNSTENTIFSLFKMASNYSEDEIKRAHEILFNEGLKMRYQVAGKEYVDASLKNKSDPFAGAMQEV